MLRFSSPRPTDVGAHDAHSPGRSSENAAATRQVTEAAEKSIDDALSVQNRQEPDTMSVTEANLSNAQQNLAAAESAFYPEEIVDRAKEVARQLAEQMAETPSTHGTLQPDEVFKLIGAG